MFFQNTSSPSCVSEWLCRSRFWLFRTFVAELEQASERGETRRIRQKVASGAAEPVFAAIPIELEAIYARGRVGREYFKRTGAH